MTSTTNTQLCALKSSNEASDVKRCGRTWT